MTNKPYPTLTNLDVADLQSPTQRLKTGVGSRNFTTEKLDPEKRESIIKGLKAGGSVVGLAQRYSVSDHTVIAVRRELEQSDPAASLAIYRRSASGTLARVAAKGAELLEKAIDNIDPADLKPGNLSAIGLTVAIAADKALSLAGEAQVVTEHRLTVDVHSVNMMLAQASNNIKQVHDDDVIDISSLSSATKGNSFAQ
jgi:transposase-like protein